MSDHNPAWPLSVPRDFYDAVADECGAPFADSYLFGGAVTGSRFLPRTLTGFEKLNDRPDFHRVMAKLEMTMVQPLPYAGPAARQILGLPDPGEKKGRRQ